MGMTEDTGVLFLDLGEGQAFTLYVLYAFYLEKEMATHSSILAWRIPWTVELEWLQFMRSQSWA